jgi:subtilase family serine protease
LIVRYEEKHQCYTCNESNSSFHNSIHQRSKKINFKINIQQIFWKKKGKCVEIMNDNEKEKDKSTNKYSWLIIMLIIFSIICIIIIIALIIMYKKKKRKNR